MKVLYLEHPQMDLGAFNLFHGLCDVLGPENVIVFPNKKLYYGEADTCKGGYLDFLRNMVKKGDIPYGIPPFQIGEDICNGWPNVLEYPHYITQPIEKKKEYSEDQIVEMIRNGSFPFLVLTSSNRVCTMALARLRDRLGGLENLPPIVYTDNGERDELNEHWVHVFHSKVIFKLILTEYERDRIKKKYGWDVYPLPHSSHFANREIRLSFSRQYVKFDGWAKNIPDYVTFNDYDKTIDVFYAMGLSYDKRQELIDLLDDFMATAPNLIGQGKGGRYDRYFNYIAHSKIAVSMRGSGRETSRYWDIPLFRTLLVCDGTMGCIHPHSFEDGKTAVFYDENNLSDLPRILYYYLENDKERERIANAGYEHLRKYHTNKARAEYFLDIVNRELQV